MPLLPLAQLADVFPGVLELPGRVAPRTLQEYRFDTQHYLAWCAWDRDRALDPQTLRTWLQHLIEHTALSPHTINRRLRAIQSLVRSSALCDTLDHAVAYRFSLVQPVGLSPLRARLRIAKAFTAVQIRMLCRAPDPTTLLGLRDRALLATLASSGCRLSEVITLRRQDLVPLLDGSPTTRGWMIEVLGKGQHAKRQAPLSHEAALWCERWRTARQAVGVDVDMVFTGFAGHHSRPTPEPVTKHTVWYRIKVYAEMVGLPQLSPHDLRRFVGTQVAAKHGLRAAQKALGHKKLETTVHHYVLDDLEPGLTEGLY